MRLLWLTMWWGMLPLGLWANNLQLQPLGTPSDTALSLLIGWENSWHLPSDSAPANHDAVWLFVKYQAADGRWYHADLQDGASLDSLLTVVVASDQKGAWVRRRSLGRGDIAAREIQLALAQPLPSDAQAVAVFGLEMAYVSPGPYWLGDGQSYHHFRDSSQGGPFFVASEAPIGAAELTTDEEGKPVGDLPAPYPKGTQGFYQMKYELGQAQYRDFLNCLSYEQQAQRSSAAPDAPAGTPALALSPAFTNRNGLVIAQPGVPGTRPARYACEANPDGQYDQPDDGQTRACNFLRWADLAAYLDWAALRPLTELEFEKSCRGPAAPVAGEFAWGTPQVVDANTVLQDGTAQETVAETATATAGLASHGYAGPQGPLRAGFGAQAVGDRLQAGAGYYGAQELSGNLWELCVGVRAAALPFDGRAGDGALSPQGEANQATWPEAAGAMHRGGAFNSGIVGDFRDLAVSDRFYHALLPEQRRNTTGGRGGRYP